MKHRAKNNNNNSNNNNNNNNKVLASCLISLSWKKNIEILIQKPSLNGLSISGAPIFFLTLAQEIIIIIIIKKKKKKKKNGFRILLGVTCQSQKKMVGSPLVRRNKHV